MADKKEAPLPAPLEECARNIHGTCDSELRFLRSSLQAPELITIGSEKIEYSNVRRNMVIDIPLQLRARLIVTKGSEKRKVQRDIQKLEASQQREMTRVSRVMEACEKIQKHIYDGCVCICRHGENGIDLLPAGRGMRI